MSSGVAGRLIKGSAWIGAGRGLATGLSVVSILILARLLHPEDFGLVALATTILALVTAVTDVSMNEAVVRHPAPTVDHLSTAWTLNALRGLLIFVAFAAISLPAAAIYNEARLPSLMAALGAGVFVSCLSNPRRVMMQRDLVFWQEVVLNVTQQVVTVIVSLAVALGWQSYWALAAGVIAGQVAMTVLSYAILPFLPRPTLRAARELLSFSLWLTAAQIVNTLNVRFDQLLVGKYAGSTALGYYSVGSNLAAMPTRELTAPLFQTMLPGFSKIASDRWRLAAGYQRAQSLVTAIALPAGIGLALVAEPLVMLAMGEKWAPAIFVVQALGTIMALQTMGSLVQPLAVSLGETRLLFVRSVQLLAMRVPIIILGLALDGLRGVIVARVLTGLIGIGVDMMLVRRFTGLSLAAQIAINGRTLLAVGVMAVGTAVIARLPWPQDSAGLAQQLVLSVLCGAALYLAAIAASWTMTGRPAGPETQILDLATKAMQRLPFGRSSPIARRARPTGRKAG